MANFGGIPFDSDQTMSRWNFENRMNVAGLGLPSLPWETGVFSQIFESNVQADGFRLPAVHPPGEPFAALEPEEEEADDPPAAGIPVFARCVQALSDQDFESSRALMWTRALACWTGIIEGSKFESLVGKHVYEYLCNDDRKGATDIIRDACGIRSPKTALKRAQDIMMMIKYCEGEGLSWWPLTERIVLKYVGGSERKSKSKLTGKNLVHALKFFKYVMGANFDLDAVLSPLVTGRVSRIVGDREPRVQARPLSLEELKILENKVYDLPNVVDRYMVGCILYAIYARCRWSDLHSIHSIEFDVIDTTDGKFGFVEVRSRVHKTGGTEEKKALFMPFVAPIAGVTERPWALAWKEAMEALGFNLWRKPYGAICRAPSASGTFGVRPVSTAEITNMLNGFLGHKEGSLLRTTSHSMKDTLLAWCARYGIDETSRTLLGHHSLQNNTMACYSRDLMTGPTRLLSAMILNVRLGNFLPDATRSGWMSSKQAPLVVVPLEEKDEVEQVDLPEEVEELSRYSPSTAEDDFEKVEDEPRSPGEIEFMKEVDAAEPMVPAKVDDLEHLLDDSMLAAQQLTVEDIFGKMDDIAQDGPVEQLDFSDWTFLNDATKNGEGEEFVESASSENDISSDEEDATDEEGFQEMQGFMATANVKPLIQGDLLQNKKTRVLHLVDEQKSSAVDNIFIATCGATGSNYRHLPNGANFQWPMCQRCYKKIDTIDRFVEQEASKRRRLTMLSQG